MSRYIYAVTSQQATGRSLRRLPRRPVTKSDLLGSHSADCLLQQSVDLCAERLAWTRIAYWQPLTDQSDDPDSTYCCVFHTSGNSDKAFDSLLLAAMVCRACQSATPMQSNRPSLGCVSFQPMGSVMWSKKICGNRSLCCTLKNEDRSLS